MIVVLGTLNGRAKRFVVSLDDPEAAKKHVAAMIPELEITGTDWTVAPKATARKLEAVEGFTASGAPEKKPNA